MNVLLNLMINRIVDNGVTINPHFFLFDVQFNYNIIIITKRKFIENNLLKVLDYLPGVINY